MVNGLIELLVAGAALTSVPKPPLPLSGLAANSSFGQFAAACRVHGRSGTHRTADAGERRMVPRDGCQQRVPASSAPKERVTRPGDASGQRTGGCAGPKQQAAALSA